MYITKILSVSLLLLLFNTVFANTIPLSSCSKLRAPKTIVLVYATWCPHCKNFLPEYRAYSNKYPGWKFYTIANDDFHNVCGAAIKGVPVIFKNNMSSALEGEASESDLDNFINNG